MLKQAPAPMLEAHMKHKHKVTAWASNQSINLHSVCMRVMCYYVCMLMW